MEENRNTVAEQDKNGKTFTQEEVNEIIKNRLSRVKGEKSETEKHLDEREKELTERENRLTANELLRDKNLPPESIGLVNLENEETLKESIELMSRLFGKKKPKYRPADGDPLCYISDAFKRP